MRSAVSVCVTTTLTCHEFVLFSPHGLSRIFTFALGTGSSVQNSESYTCFCLLSAGGKCKTKHQSIFQHFLCLQFLPRYQFPPKQIAHPKECFLQSFQWIVLWFCFSLEDGRLFPDFSETNLNLADFP